MKRIAGALTALLLVGTLAGCGSSNAGVAARVGDETISVGRLEDLVEEALKDTAFSARVGDQTTNYQREVLNRLVTRVLTRETARRLSVTVPDKEVDDAIAEFDAQARQQRSTLEKQASEQGIPPSELRTVIADFVLQQALVDKLAESEPLTPQQLHSLDEVTVQHVLVREKALADRLYADLRRGANFDAVARQHTTDPSSKDAGGRLPPSRGGAFVPEFDRVAFSAPLNTVVGPVRTQFGWHVLKVLARRTVDRDSITPEQRRQALGQVGEQLFGRYMSRLAEELGVRVNPRFGTWNATEARIDAPPDALSSPSPPPPAPTIPGGPGGPGGRPGGQPPAGQPTAPAGG